MNIDSNTMISILEASQNFSKVTRIVNQYGSAVILEDNTPKYVITEFNQADEIQNASDNDVIESSKRLMKKNQKVYEELAK